MVIFLLCLKAYKIRQMKPSIKFWKENVLQFYKKLINRKFVSLTMEILYICHQVHVTQETLFCHKKHT